MANDVLFFSATNEKKHLTRISDVTEYNTWVFFFLGGPIDLMARRVLAAGSQEIAEKASKHLECIDLPRD